MARPRMRPVFEIEAVCDEDTLRQVLRDFLGKGEHGVVGELTTRQCALSVVSERRRFFTPSLDLTFEERQSPSQEVRTRIWGTFSPRAEIWTGFVFAIGSLIILSIFATVYGVAQLALGTFPTALGIPVVAAGVAILLYLAALVGQGLSIAEMYRLRAFVDDCLRTAEAPPIAAPMTHRADSSDASR